MSINWEEVIKFIGGTAVIMGALGWFIKAIINQFLQRELEKHKSDLKLESTLEIQTHGNALKHASDQLLAEQKAKFEQQMVEFQAEVDARTARADRVRQEIERWANPILGAVRDLESRLGNILNKSAYLALSKDIPAGERLPGGWTITYAYFLPSTVFLFCQYFCWVRILRERLTFDLFSKGAQKDQFVARMDAVGHALSSWPLEELDDVPPETDLQLFTLQQRALGETMVVGEGAEARCMSLAHFLEEWSKANFRQKFKTLEQLVEGLNPQAVGRWRRLELMLSALGALRAECERVLSPPEANPKAQ